MANVLRRWWSVRQGWPWVRPWGLTPPILVLLICLPLLRPLRHPTDISENERARLATIQCIVEHGTLAIDRAEPELRQTREKIVVSRVVGDRVVTRGTYSRQPPVFAVIASGVYRLLHAIGLTLAGDGPLVSYLLTIVCVTLPVAATAALVYRMGRLFELRRPWRMTLSLACVFGSGLIAYATALNSHAPAAALIVAACGALMHAGMTHKRHGPGWVALAGFAVALAATLDMAAIVFVGLLALVVLAMRWTTAQRIVGVLFYIGGALIPLAAHAALTIPITGDLRPGFLHTELFPTEQSAGALDPDDDDSPSLAGRAVARITDGILGAHGLLTHFPVLVFALVGVGTVLHRHWPSATKTMALACIGGGAIVVGAYAFMEANWDQPMFAVRWFIVFTPICAFWSGAWLRQRHNATAWTLAGVAVGFSAAVSLLGALEPFTDARPGEYTAYAAARQIFRGTPATPTPPGRR